MLPPLSPCRCCGFEFVSDAPKCPCCDFPREDGEGGVREPVDPNPGPLEPMKETLHL